MAAADGRRWFVCGQALALESVSVVLTLWLTMVGGTERSTVHPGRHVCVQQRQRAQPVPYRQSYRRAYYRQTMHMCEGFRVCSRLSLAYQTAYRTVFHMQIRTQLVHGCCPGWKQASPRDNSCSLPVCSEGCEHGGKCVAPESCQCSKGWTGNNCQKDVDECSGANRCQQRCENLPGSYECSCQDGFKISSDGATCAICLSCLSEFQAMQQSVTTLTSRLEELETEKNALMSNLTSMSTHYEQMKDQMLAVQASTPMTSASPQTSRHDDDKTDKLDYADLMVGGGYMPGFDRLASLSNQISLLEERMADCTCQNYDDPR